MARGPDRIAHFLLDAMVDNFQPIIDEMRGELEEIEETVLSKNSDGLIPDLMHARADITLLRQIIRPQRELVTRLAHGENKLIRALMLPYFRDLRDNLMRMEETAAGFADQLLISFDLYLSKSDYEANQGIKTLTARTRKDNARFFGSEDAVPFHVITMGIGTILDTRKTVLLATGKNKAQAVAQAVEGPITSMNPASALQLHPSAIFCLDEEAASELTRADYYRWVFDNKPAWQVI